MNKFTILCFTAVLLIGFVAYRYYYQRHIIFGAWTEGLYDPTTKRLQVEKLKQFEDLAHKKVTIAHYYRGWEALAESDLITEFDSLRTHNWVPMINANPYFFSECTSQKESIYKAIADGDCDSFLRRAGKNLSTIKKPFYLLFAWEMNNPQIEWSLKYTGSTAADFVSAWRHIHTIFKEEHVTNAIWVFCPNTQDANTSYADLYPGDSYVDWIGLDGYNWGTTQSWSHWQSFAEVFTASYSQLVNVAPEKPFMLAEVNTTDQGGNKGAWYIEMFTKQLPYNFPKIKMVIIYNEDRTKTEKVNWRIDTTEESLNGFREGISSRYY